ncbi:TPA: hypothetical protein JAN03_23900 [Citrobacter freundii]|nr:hypothetical protein [Citrobacter freundii]
MNSLSVVKKAFLTGIFIVALFGCDDNKSEKENRNISQQQVSLTSVLNGKVKINLPEGFKKMSDEERVKKYSTHQQKRGMLKMVMSDLHLD